MCAARNTSGNSVNCKETLFQFRNLWNKKFKFQSSAVFHSLFDFRMNSSLWQLPYIPCLKSQALQTFWIPKRKWRRHVLAFVRLCLFSFCQYHFKAEARLNNYLRIPTLSERKKQHFAVTNTNLLKLFEDTMPLCAHNDPRPVNTKCTVRYRVLTAWHTVPTGLLGWTAVTYATYAQSKHTITWRQTWRIVNPVCQTYDRREDQVSLDHLHLKLPG